MIDAGLEADVSPKGSRRPVDRRWVSDVPPPSQTFMGIACHACHGTCVGRHEVTFPLVPQGAGIVQQG